MDKSKQSGKQTLVEEGTELKGTLKSTCQVVVNGSIDGQIEAPSLMIAESGTVLGTVRAQKLRSEGNLGGDIDADDVYLSGVVRSNTMIRARKLEVKLEPQRGKLEVTFGECLLEVGEDPAHVRAEPEAKTTRVEEHAAAPVASIEPPPAKAPEEPTWSEPPRADAPVAGATDALATSPRESWPAGESGGSSANGEGRRSKKAQERRESQAPSS
jgi:cytoskeletal protein CcmA (bactofilin family)